MNILAESEGLVGEFKTFILKGNVVNLAVGIAIGAAFGKVVEAITTGIITPLINLAMGNHHQLALKLWIFDAGMVINATLTFLISAAVIFFFVVKPMNGLFAMASRMAKEKPAEAAPLPEDVKLLMEIRDLLKAGVNPGAGVVPTRSAESDSSRG
jgi:large conductance mechanosensitive channel